MRVAVTIDPKDLHRDSVRDGAEFWLGNRARSGWRVRAKEGSYGGEVLAFGFTGPLGAIDFHMRAETAERRARLDWCAPGIPSCQRSLAIAAT